mgnify:FL=1|jgi:hypothetical protein
MAGSIMVTFKTKLLSELTSIPGTAGVKMSFGDPGENALKENIWFGRIFNNEHDAVALKAGRRRREENFTLEVYVEVGGTRLTPERSETRALELGLLIEEYLADNPKLDGTVDCLLFAVVSGMELFTSSTTDGPLTRYTISVDVKARLL